MLPLIIFIVGVVIIILNFIGRTSNQVQNSKSAYEYAKQIVQKENITISKELQYNLLLVQKMRLIVDDKNKKMHIFYLNYPKIEIPYNKIMGCEVYHNGTVIGGVKRAIAGGIIAGGAGAVVGALTANKKMSSIGLKIIQNDLQRPELIFPLIDPATDGEAPKDTKLCQEALGFANSVVATINVIIQQTNEQKGEVLIRNRSDISTELNKENDCFEQIKKYKELLDLGIITQEEFNIKKVELLGIGNNTQLSVPSASQANTSPSEIKKPANSASNKTPVSHLYFKNNNQSSLDTDELCKYYDDAQKVCTLVSSEYYYSDCYETHKHEQCAYKLTSRENETNKKIKNIIEEMTGMNRQEKLIFLSDAYSDDRINYEEYKAIFEQENL